MKSKFCLTLLVALAAFSGAASAAADPEWFKTPEPQGTGSRKVSVASGQSLQDAFNKAKPGDILELDRRVGEPVDIFVNNRLIAKGEIVLIGNSLGVTMTEILRQEN